MKNFYLLCDNTSSVVQDFLKKKADPIFEISSI